MSTIKISSKVDEAIRNELRQFAGESHQSISGLLTEAIREFLHNSCVRPVVLIHPAESIAANEELGRLLCS